jgi:hypothetical protein
LESKGKLKNQEQLEPGFQLGHIKIQVTETNAKPSGPWGPYVGANETTICPYFFPFTQDSNSPTKGTDD